MFGTQNLWPLSTFVDYKIKFFGETYMKNFYTIKKTPTNSGNKTGNESKARLIAEKNDNLFFVAKKIFFIS